MAAGLTMFVQRLHHVQIAMPQGGEDMARGFYRDALGIPETPKPEPLASRGGCWFEAGELRLHLGWESDFRPARKAHPALIVSDLAALSARLADLGHPVQPAEPLDGQTRAFVDDPFGNRIELIELG